MFKKRPRAVNATVGDANAGVVAVGEEDAGAADIEVKETSTSASAALTQPRLPQPSAEQPTETMRNATTPASASPIVNDENSLSDAFGGAAAAPQQGRSLVCKMFRDKGTCRYGEECKYAHVHEDGTGKGPRGATKLDAEVSSWRALSATVGSSAAHSKRAER
jgi:hypothetical protein